MKIILYHGAHLKIYCGLKFILFKVSLDEKHLITNKIIKSIHISTTTTGAFP